MSGLMIAFVAKTAKRALTRSFCSPRSLLSSCCERHSLTWSGRGSHFCELWPKIYCVVQGRVSATSHQSSLEPQDRPSEIGREEGMVLEREFRWSGCPWKCWARIGKSGLKALNRGGLGLETSLWALALGHRGKNDGRNNEGGCAVVGGS